MGESKHSVGVDWASGNWLAVEYRSKEYERVTPAGDFTELWERFDPKPDRVRVDVSDETFRKISRELAEHEDEVDVADVEADDVLDAMALAITACANEDE